MARTFDSAAVATRHQETADKIRRDATSTSDPLHRSLLESQALAYETLARQLELSHERAAEIKETTKRAAKLLPRPKGEDQV
jgi:hypothetical protein